MTSDDRFATSVALIRNFEKWDFHTDHELDGVIILDAGVINDLIRLDGDGAIDQVAIGNKIIAGNFAKTLPSEEGTRATVRLILTAVGSVYRSFDIFLNYNDNHTIKPHQFYAVEEDIDSRDEKPKDLLLGYNDVTSFIEMLAQLSDMPDRFRSGEDIFFAGATRREIPPNYKSTDIRILPELTELRINLLTELHHEEKRGIFKTTLLDLISDENDENALFKILLQRYEILKKKYFEAYNVYVQQFSADEIMQEVQEKNLELASKLHSAIVDLHKSMFALPIAFIFAATRIDPSAAYSISNTIILICSWIAVALFFISLSSHWKTLNFVCNEIETQKGNASRYKDLEDRLMPPYNNLIDRCTFQRQLMISLGSALMVVFITLTGLYFYTGNKPQKMKASPNSELQSQLQYCVPPCANCTYIFIGKKNNFLNSWPYSKGKKKESK